MGVKKQNQFTKEYKLDAVKLAKELGSVVEAAKKLGITPKNIYNWKDHCKRCLKDILQPAS